MTPDTGTFLNATVHVYRVIFNLFNGYNAHALFRNNNMHRMSYTYRERGSAHPRYQLCPPADCCFSDIALYNLNKRVGLLQSGHHHYFIESNSTSPLYSSNCTHLELNNNHALFCQLFLFDRGLLVVRVVVTGCIGNNDCLRFDRDIVRVVVTGCIGNNDCLGFDRDIVRVVVTGCIGNNDCLRFDRGIVRVVCNWLYWQQ